MAESATAAPVHQVKSTASTAASEYGYPRGHLGHLTEHEEGQLRAFRAMCQERGLYKPGPPPSHDDVVLLRFLRARRWVVEDAFKQFKDTHEWRIANDIDVLYRTIDLDAYDQSRRMYPQWTGRRDRRGIPLYLFEIRHLDSKSVAAYEKAGRDNTFSQAKHHDKTPPSMLRLFALYENLTRFNQPFCTQLQDREWPGTPITMSTNIVDVSGVGLKMFWNLKGHMQAASQLATAHYPETLDRIFIIGAPPFFSTVWQWIKRWFDPVTVSKIFILSHSEVRPTLEKFIDPRNIPKKYGGELDFNWGDVHKKDPAWEGVVEFAEGFDNFPVGPMVWRDVEGDETRVECIFMGSVEGKEQVKRVCTVPKTWSPPPLGGEIAAAEGEAKAGEAEQKHATVEPVAGSIAAAPATSAAATTAPQTETVSEPQPATTTPAAPADPSAESKMTEEAAEEKVTSGEAMQSLTVSEAITGKSADVDTSEKVPSEEVPPALPTTVA